MKSAIHHSSSIRRCSLGLIVAGLAMIFWPNADRTASQSVAEHTLVSASTHASRTTDLTHQTRPIESIRVGDRVLARNPEVSDAERVTWSEPEWNDWLHLSLQMPLPVDEDESSKVLKIEILRPESWLGEQIGFVVDSKDERSSSDGPDTDGTEAPAADESGVADPQLVPLSPLRGIYRDLAIVSTELDAGGLELVGLTVEMDLPEMGAAGTAVITDIHPCPSIQPGDGQVVTATFSHPPSTQVLDVRLENESDHIGVTDNHLFWSVDRQQFIPIGQMELGERLVTYSGQTKRIESRLPRPGPQTVYNLEVYGEHVYFVGQQGLLAHNTCAPNPTVRVVDDAVPQYGTPFQPLSSAQRKTLKAKVDARTITQQEYKHLEWDRRFANRRATGVRRFWAQERATLRSGGAGTRPWTDAQRADILAGRTPQFGGESIQGHHLYNALDHPHIANEPWNIYPTTRAEHFQRWHGGNWQNDTFGSPLNPQFLEEF
ncbi:MAG: hypothetical protein MI861_16885 [Pirellulales bacterium]|nr:hypothetical protein [Pirellulales bacterium]